MALTRGCMAPQVAGSCRPPVRPPALSPPRFAAIFPTMSTTIAIEVNGETREVPEGASVAALLGLIGLAAPKVAVERNLEIVPRSAWDSTILAQGDRLEIVHFIGGG